MPTSTLVRPLPDLDVADRPEAPSSAEDWEERRSKFRHDWLKNRFLNLLKSFLSLLDEPNPDPSFTWEFVDEDLRTWPEKSAEARVLVDAYRDCLSPQNLVDREPLRHLDDSTRRQLGELTDALWHARTGPEAAVEETHEALDQVGEIYSRIAAAVDGADAESVEELKELRPTFEALRRACGDLSDAFGNFQRSIQVT